MVTKMLKFAVCDDEPFMVQEISHHISTYMKAKHLVSYSTRCFSGGRSLLDSDCDFDLIFLDIQMEQPDGMATARLLRQQGKHCLLVFVTVLKEHVFDAFELEAYDYLVKPLDGCHFRRTLDRALRTLEQRPAKSIVVQKGTACDIIPLNHIVYCEVQGRKIYIPQKDGKITGYYERLNVFEQRVDGRFFRCHRSYLVNLAYVSVSHAGKILLSQGGRIPVSRLRERDLAQTLLRYMAGKDP